MHISDELINFFKSTCPYDIAWPERTPDPYKNHYKSMLYFLFILSTYSRDLLKGETGRASLQKAGFSDENVGIIHNSITTIYMCLDHGINSLYRRTNINTSSLKSLPNSLIGLSNYFIAEASDANHRADELFKEGNEHAKRFFNAVRRGEIRTIQEYCGYAKNRLPFEYHRLRNLPITEVDVEIKKIGWPAKIVECDAAVEKNEKSAKFSGIFASYINDFVFQLEALGLRHTPPQRPIAAVVDINDYRRHKNSLRI